MSFEALQKLSGEPTTLMATLLLSSSLVDITSNAASKLTVNDVLLPHPHIFCSSDGTAPHGVSGGLMNFNRARTAAAQGTTPHRLIFSIPESAQLMNFNRARIAAIQGESPHQLPVPESAALDLPVFQAAASCVLKNLNVSRLTLLIYASCFHKLLSAKPHPVASYLQLLNACARCNALHKSLLCSVKPGLDHDNYIRFITITLANYLIKLKLFPMHVGNLRFLMAF